jgi:hypothetical protein
MPEDADKKKDLRWFLYNLDLQLEDISLEKSNKTTELFFDTSDTRSAVLGLNDLYDPVTRRFNFGKFEHEETLVHCLAAGEWLGRIYLLPPHQAEFLTLLKEDFWVVPERDPVGVARRFLQQAGLKMTKKQLSSVGSLSETKLNQLVRRQAGSAQRFFKAIQCIVPWRIRLTNMLDKGTLQLVSQNFNYEQIIHNPVFSTLQAAFTSARKDKPIQNMADIIAILLLMDKVRRFRLGQEKSLPLLFVSSPVFLDIVRQEKVAEHLTYKNKEGKTISILRDKDYFVFKSTFRPSSTLRPEVDEQSRSKSENYLRTLHQEVTKILQARDETKVEAAIEIGDTAGRRVSLNAFIEELRRFSFLENVWLPWEAPRTLDQNIRQLIQAVPEVKVKGTKKFRSSVDKTLDGLKENLSKNVKQVEAVMLLWNGLEKRAREVSRQLNSGPQRSTDYFRDFGLLRYSFPSRTHARIEEVLNQLLQPGSAEEQARKFVITGYLQGGRDPQDYTDELIVSAAVLRAFELKYELLNLLEKVDGDRDKRLPHFSLNIMFAELISKFGRQDRRIERVISQLEKEYRGKSQRAQADLAVGLAYLYFRLWQSRGGEALWRLRPEVYKNSRDLGLDKTIREAFTHAHQAYEAVRQLRPDRKDINVLKKEVYGLNIYLYYMVEGACKEFESKINDAAHDLTSYAERSEVWQYRFDDTLARYYHRQAASAETEERWLELMRSARRYIEKAQLHARNDREVDGYMQKIEIAIDRGFESRHPFFD